jgi:hypothetical protein
LILSIPLKEISLKCSAEFESASNSKQSLPNYNILKSYKSVSAWPPLTPAKRKLACVIPEKSVRGKWHFRWGRICNLKKETLH